jgi:hypothetical protein
MLVLSRGRNSTTIHLGKHTVTPVPAANRTRRHHTYGVRRRLG